MATLPHTETQSPHAFPRSQFIYNNKQKIFQHLWRILETRPRVSSRRRRRKPVTSLVKKQKRQRSSLKAKFRRQQKPFQELHQAHKDWSVELQMMQRRELRMPRRKLVSWWVEFKGLGSFMSSLKKFQMKLSRNFKANFQAFSMETSRIFQRKLPRIFRGNFQEFSRETCKNFQS